MNTALPEKLHRLSPDDLRTQLNTDLQHGLTEADVRQRQAQYGLNALQEAEKEGWMAILLRQFNSIIVWILAAAAIVSFVLGDTVEGFAILAVILINAITGFVLEFNAQQSMEALRKMDSNPARVLRDGRVREIASEEVTMGDILVVEAGDLVAADAK